MTAARSYDQNAPEPHRRHTSGFDHLSLKPEKTVNAHNALRAHVNASALTRPGGSPVAPAPVVPQAPEAGLPAVPSSRCVWKAQCASPGLSQGPASRRGYALQ
jgi:hypothetical protein